MLTNRHVVRGATTVTVEIDGRAYRATVVVAPPAGVLLGRVRQLDPGAARLTTRQLRAALADTDVALLRVDTGDDLPQVSALPVGAPPAPGQRGERHRLQRPPASRGRVGRPGDQQPRRGTAHSHHRYRGRSLSRHRCGFPRRGHWSWQARGGWVRAVPVALCSSSIPTLVWLISWGCMPGSPRRWIRSLCPPPLVVGPGATLIRAYLEAQAPATTAAEGSDLAGTGRGGHGPAVGGAGDAVPAVAVSVAGAREQDGPRPRPYQLPGARDPPPARRHTQYGAALAGLVLASRLVVPPVGPSLMVPGDWIWIPGHTPPNQTTTSQPAPGQAAAAPVVRGRAGGTEPAAAAGHRAPQVGTEEQRRNAAIVIATGRAMGVSDRGLQVALATALQESGLRNLHYGDRDSQGLFQQRPSQGWGTPAQVTTPSYAARKFFQALVKVRGWEAMPLTRAAQQVQHSAYPGAYAKRESLAAALLHELTPAPTPPPAPAPAPAPPAPGLAGARQSGPVAVGWGAGRYVQTPAHPLAPPAPVVHRLVSGRVQRPERPSQRPAGRGAVATGSSRPATPPLATAVADEGAVGTSVTSQTLAENPTDAAQRAVPGPRHARPVDNSQLAGLIGAGTALGWVLGAIGTAVHAIIPASLGLVIGSVTAAAVTGTVVIVWSIQRNAPPSTRITTHAAKHAPSARRITHAPRHAKSPRHAASRRSGTPARRSGRAATRSSGPQHTKTSRRGSADTADRRHTEGPVAGQSDMSITPHTGRVRRAGRVVLRTARALVGIGAVVLVTTLSSPVGAPGPPLDMAANTTSDTRSPIQVLAHSVPGQRPSTVLIERGDSLDTLADRLELDSPDALLTANPHVTDPNKILAGGRLRLPSGWRGVCTLADGEGLWTAAQRFAITDAAVGNGWRVPRGWNRTLIGGRPLTRLPAGLAMSLVPPSSNSGAGLAAQHNPPHTEPTSAKTNPHRPPVTRHSFRGVPIRGPPWALRWVTGVLAVVWSMLRRAPQRGRHAVSRRSRSRGRELAAWRGRDGQADTPPDGVSGRHRVGDQRRAAAARHSIVLPHTPAQIASWWAALSHVEQRRLLAAEPELIGSLDGLPTQVRHSANTAVLAATLQHLPHTLAHTPPWALVRRAALRGALRGLGQLQNWLTDTELTAPTYLLLLDTEGPGRAVIALNDPDTARSVQVLVPGLTHRLATVDTAIHQIGATRSAALRWGESDLAVIAHWGVDQPRTLLAAAFQHRARVAAPVLHRFLHGLAATTGPDARVSVAAHSYGSVIAATTATTLGLPGVASLVIAGSPDVGVGHSQVLRARMQAGAEVWAIRADGDIVTHTLPLLHGPHPASAQFGASVIDGGPKAAVNPIRAHMASRYWRETSPTLWALAAVAIGQTDRITPIFGPACPARPAGVAYLGGHDPPMHRWAQLSAAKRDGWIRAEPALLGAHERLPVADRDRANRIVLARHKTELDARSEELQRLGVEASHSLWHESLTEVDHKLAVTAQLEQALASDAAAGVSGQLPHRRPRSGNPRSRPGPHPTHHPLPPAHRPSRYPAH